MIERKKMMRKNARLKIPKHLMLTISLHNFVMKLVRLKCGKAFPTTYAALIQTVNVDKC
jgi:hypothetical protein